MSRFNERDVRHMYDLLQHNPEEGLTQLNAFDQGNLIGVGLFDNEDGFVSECLRYNELGQVLVGINPRGLHLLDAFGGLKNRMRTLFTDVVGVEDVVAITGAAVVGAGLTEAALAYRKDVSELDDGMLFFPMDKPISIEVGQHAERIAQVGRWFYGAGGEEALSLMQMVPVPGSAKPGRRWWRSRVRFRKYRPYILDGISAAITGEDNG